MSLRVFISSTPGDLAKHRKAAIRALRASGFHVDPMQEWCDNAPCEVNTEHLNQCDLCVLIVGRRRGYVPPGERRSIPQKEYDYACVHRIPVLVFLLDGKEDWPAEFDEIAHPPMLGDDQKILDWRAEIAAQHCGGRFGADPESLARVLGNSLMRWKDRRASLDIDALKSTLANLSIEQKRLALYWLLHDMLGDQPDKEVGVFDPDEFLYLWLVPVGHREALRYLEEPNLAEQLERASLEPAIPLNEARRQIFEELGISEEELGPSE